MPENEYPLSTQQRRMVEFIGSRVDSYYVVVEAFVLDGDVDMGRLREAMISVLDRNDMLRAVYPAARDTYRVVGKGAELIDQVWTQDIPCVHGTVDEALKVGRNVVSVTLQLDEEPPLRCWWAPLADGRTAWVLGGHHLVFDDWTFMLLYEDLAAEYRRLTKGDQSRCLPPQYADAQAPEDPAALEGWEELFRRSYHGIRKLAAAATTPKGPGLVLRENWAGLGEPVTVAAKQLAVTPFLLGSAAMLHALADLLGDKQAIFGSAYAGRTTTAAIGAMGYYSTTLFVGADLGEHGTTKELLGTLLGQQRRWHNSTRVQWEDLLPRYDAQDLYPVKFAFQPRELSERLIRLPGVRVRKVPLLKPNLTARRPADLTATYDKESVSVSLTVRTDAVPEELAQELLNLFRLRLTELTA